MDNQRLFIWAALALVLWMNYQAWQRHYAPPPVPAPAQSSTATPNAAPTDSLPQLPTESPTPAPQSATPAPAPEQPIETAKNNASVVRVGTDVLSVDMSTRG